MTNRSMYSDVANDMADDIYGTHRFEPFRFDLFNGWLAHINRIAWAFRYQEEHQ